MAGHSAACGQNALSGIHTADILRARLDPDQDDLLALIPPLLGKIGTEDHLSDRCTRRGGQTCRNDFPRGLGIEMRMKEPVDLFRRNAGHRSLGGYELFLDHIDGVLDRCCGGTLAGTSLEDIKRPFLDGELHILHVLIMLLQPGHHAG